MGDLIGQGHFVVNHIKVAHRGVHIDRFHRIATREVDTVEVLCQAQKVGALLAGARHLVADLHVKIIGRRGHVAKQVMVAADGDFTVGVARCDVELRRRIAEHFHHPLAAHAHIGAIHSAARLFKNLQRLRVEELDPNVLKDGHRTIVNGRDTLGTKRFCGPVGVDGNAPRHLINDLMAAPCRIACPAAAAPPWCL